MTETEFRLTVNGAERSVTCEPDTPLLDVLRHDLGLTGPKFGCGMGLCGACMVLIGLPRVFRTTKLSLFHAASCRFRYSSRASCGVRYPSPE
jgi:aerobic-type carbon monoxide dehydrogenase small subunit (CoxS/CutS family)